MYISVNLGKYIQSVTTSTVKTEHFCHPQKIPLFSLNSHFLGCRQTLICFLSPCGLDLS